MTIFDSAVVEFKRAQRDCSQADWGFIVSSPNESILAQFRPCQACGGLARYEGQACADKHWVKLCERCLDVAMYKLNRMRDDAKLTTGHEPLCNRCWRPILDPSTHMEVRSLMTDDCVGSPLAW